MRPNFLATATAVALLATAAACSDATTGTPSPALETPPSGVTGALTDAQTSGRAFSLVSATAATRCAEVRNDSRSAITPVVIATCNGSAGEQLTWRTDGTLRVYSNTLCLDAWGGSGRDGDRIYTVDCHGDRNQLWRATAAGEVRGINDKCLTAGAATNGTQLYIQTCTGAANQRWTERFVDGSTTTPPTQTVATVGVTPSTHSMPRGQTATFVATARDASGNTITGRTVTWISSNTSVATVSATGVVSALALGSAVITATIDGRSGSSNLTVTAPAPSVVGIDITPGSASLAAGAVQQFAATARLSDGTTQGAGAAWIATGGTIDLTGRYTAGSTGGSYRVIATAGALADTAVVTITASTGGGVPTNPTCSNQPAGYTAGLNTPWNTLPTLQPVYSTEGYRYYAGQASTLQLVNDTQSPTSPGSVLRINYPQGFGGGSAPSRFGSRNLPANSGSIYVCAMFRFSAGWENNGNNGTKLFFIRGYPTEDALNHFVGTQGAGSRLTMITGLQARTQGVNYGTTGTESELTGGTWKKIEVLWEANVPGQNNGRLRHWINGQLVYSSDAVRFFDTGQTARWDYIWFDPTYGGGYNPVPRLQWQEYDHFYVAVR